MTKSNKYVAIYRFSDLRPVLSPSRLGDLLLEENRSLLTDGLPLALRLRKEAVKNKCRHLKNITTN